MGTTNFEHNQPHLKDSRSSGRGFSALELLIVVSVIAIGSAVIIPQVAALRRLQRSQQVPREIVAQMRHARQLAISDRAAVTFQYADATKQITIINHKFNPDGTAKTQSDGVTLNLSTSPASGKAILADTSNYPNQNGFTVKTIPLTTQSEVINDITYGVPPGVTSVPLDDTAGLTALNTSTQKFNLTFQPDGSVIDSNGNPVNGAFYLYNSKAPKDTAVAISILGAAGRIKAWRYVNSANKYVE
jgi:prepilin-type N-terminal cleavage/methylation domain-containing protein